MVAASFSAWQALAAKIKNPPTWDKYLRQFGLSDEPELTKEDLKREADHAMENVEAILRKAKKGTHASR